MIRFLLRQKRTLNIHVNTATHAWCGSLRNLHNAELMMHRIKTAKRRKNNPRTTSTQNHLLNMHPFTRTVNRYRPDSTDDHSLTWSWKRVKNVNALRVHYDCRVQYVHVPSSGVRVTHRHFLCWGERIRKPPWWSLSNSMQLSLAQQLDPLLYEMWPNAPFTAAWM